MNRFSCGVYQEDKKDLIFCFPFLAGETKQLPLGLWKIIQCCYSDFNVFFIDARFEDPIASIEECLTKERTIFIGLSVMTGEQILSALTISKYFHGKVPIVWGGLHPTIAPEQTITNENIDYIVTGEGEKAALTLARLLKDEGIKEYVGFNAPPYRYNIYKDFAQQRYSPEISIDERYFITRDGITRGIGVETSRSCPYSCKFCHNSVRPSRSYRQIPADGVINIIDSLIQHYSITGVIFQEDLFFGGQRAFPLLDFFIKKNRTFAWKANGRISLFSNLPNNELIKIADSGCTCLQFGVESGSDKILKYINKKHSVKDVLHVNSLLSRFPIPIRYNFIIGFPGESPSEIQETLELAARLRDKNKNVESPFVNIYTPYPGTKLYNDAVKFGFSPPTDLLGWAKIVWNNPSPGLHDHVSSFLRSTSVTFAQQSSYYKFMKGK